MPAASPKAAWESKHDLALLRATVQLILSNRSTLYATPILADVSHNGGDKINKRIQIILAKMVAAYPGAEGMVKEEVAKLGRGGGKRKSTGASSDDGTPKKRKAAGKKVPKEEVEDMESEDEE